MENRSPLFIRVGERCAWVSTRFTAFSDFELSYAALKLKINVPQLLIIVQSNYGLKKIEFEIVLHVVRKYRENGNNGT